MDEHIHPFTCKQASKLTQHPSSPSSKHPSIHHRHETKLNGSDEFNRSPGWKVHE